jgi:hypothetical protein
VRRGSETLAAALASLLLAAGLAACGGGDDTTGRPSASATGSTGKSGGSRSSGSESGKSNPTGPSGSTGGGSGKEAAEFEPKPHHDSGGGSTQYEVKGGDNSVQEFGQEAGESEFEAAATALHDFLDARAAGDWDATCRYLSKSTAESFEKLAARGKQGGDTSCGAVLGGLINPNAAQSMREEAAKADIGSLRTEGDQAFLIYTAGGDTILAMPMAREGGGWKVASLAGTPLN